MSRRSFVAASGSALGVTALGLGRGARDAAAVTVTASDPYRPAVAERVDGPPGDGASVSVQSPTGDPVAAVAGGDVDAHVTGRPRIVSADGTVRSSARETIVVGRGTFVHDRSGWCECLDVADLRERATDDAVEAWSETDWRSFDAVEPVDGVAGTARPVVRGTRSFQYARGHGGVGYYPVEREAVRTGPVDGAPRRSEGSTPLVRLGYVHGDLSTAEKGDSALRRLTGRDGREAAGELSYFAAPALGDRG